MAKRVPGESPGPEGWRALCPPLKGGTAKGMTKGVRQEVA
jgi:hypothetical protein